MIQLTWLVIDPKTKVIVDKIPCMVSSKKIVAVVSLDTGIGSKVFCDGGFVMFALESPASVKSLMLQTTEN